MFKPIGFCRKCINEETWEHGYSWPFQQPVDTVALNLSDYHDVILHPFDLGTKKQRLKDKYYFDANAAIADISLMILNCIMYNGHNDDIVIIARNLQTILTKEMKSMPANQKGIEKPLTNEKTANNDDDSSLLVTDHSVVPQNNAGYYGLYLLSAAAAEMSETQQSLEPNVGLHSNFHHLFILVSVFFMKESNNTYIYFFFKLQESVVRSTEIHPVKNEMQICNGKLFKTSRIADLKNPMDLNTIEKKMNGDEYTTSLEFAADVRLIFTNC